MQTLKNKVGRVLMVTNFDNAKLSADTCLEHGLAIENMYFQLL